LRLERGGQPFVSYEYDALNRRISRTWGANREDYVYDGYHLIAVKAGGAIIERFIYTDKLDDLIFIEKAGTNYKVLSSIEGNVDCLVDDAGNIVEHYDYSLTGEVKVFNGQGQPLNQPPISRFLFQSRLYDSDTGLYDYRARFYHPILGQFVTPDPLGFSQGANFYGLNHGDPVNFADPLGLDDGPNYLWFDSPDAPRKVRLQREPTFFETVGYAYVTVFDKITLGKVDWLHRVAGDSGGAIGLNQQQVKAADTISNLTAQAEHFLAIQSVLGKVAGAAKALAIGTRAWPAVRSGLLGLRLWGIKSGVEQAGKGVAELSSANDAWDSLQGLGDVGFGLANLLPTLGRRSQEVKDAVSRQQSRYQTEVAAQAGTHEMVFWNWLTGLVPFRSAMSPYEARMPDAELVGLKTLDKGKDISFRTVSAMTQVSHGSDTETQAMAFAGNLRARSSRGDDTTHANLLSMGSLPAVDRRCGRMPTGVAMMSSISASTGGITCGFLACPVMVRRQASRWIISDEFIPHSGASMQHR
jgi:RHS repeat-associated protein